MFDVAVIGAGVVGGFVARSLVKRGAKVVILEKGADVASGASRANSGIVHAGFDAVNGSKKAYFNVLGNQMMESVCEELGVAFKRNGSLVLSFGSDDGIDELIERGKKNGVTGLKKLNAKEIYELEPCVEEGVTSALYAPTGGIVCPYNLTIASVGNAMDNGAQLFTDFEVVKIEKGFTIYASDGRSVNAKYIVNCAGAGSEKIANLLGDYSFKVGLRKGEYMLLDRTVGSYAKKTLFTLPTKAGKGVLVSPTVHGNLLVGPTSFELDEEDKSIRREGFDDIKVKANAMCKNIPYGSTITSFAGLRAYCDRHDFIIEESKVCGLFNLAGIESPGLTSAPAIGEFVAEIVAKKVGAKGNKNFNPYRKPNDFFKKMSVEEKNALIKEKPQFGKIVCRCESVTLGEIEYAMNANPKARTIDGIKLRTRAGMGRCQSGFCQPVVLEAVMKEYGLNFDEVTKNGGQSLIIKGGEK